MNETTYWDQIPGVVMGGGDAPDCEEDPGTEGQIRERRYNTDTEHGREECPSCQVRVDPAGAVSFGYVLGNYPFVDLRL